MMDCGLLSLIMRMQTVLQAMKVFFLFIFIVLDLFGMFHGLSATMPFFFRTMSMLWVFPFMDTACCLYRYSVSLNCLIMSAK